MKLYVQLMYILIFSLLGECLSTSFSLPVPGSIIGLVLLFLSLQFKIIRLRHIYDVGQFLLSNMTILFFPAAVGVMDKFDVIAPNLVGIVVITLGAIVLNIATLGLVVPVIKRRYEGDYVDGRTSRE
ncbi:CidA/LrgA family protein [Streptococcus hyointestinalis]|uniref:CidA/LrgA family protein n=1 Tax=Streptococcus hyointestinalis TaxID=1337 RepID=UPI0013E097F7|nr:CidA/LrgA family protein [Streptococcus hyointestinalis]